MRHDTDREPHDSAWSIAVAGAVSLAVAMGIGRFAFTPLLPMMLADGVVDLHAASWLASANYLGYLAGALLCTFQPMIWARVPSLPAIDPPALVRGGLAATGLLTLGMALPAPYAWPALRFAAGVASAVVFVYTSGWCLAQLARHNAAALGGAIFTGPGAGIVVSGLMVGAMSDRHWHASAGWLVFGALAFVLSATVWRTFRGERAPAPVVNGVPASDASSSNVSSSNGASSKAAPNAVVHPISSSATPDISHGRTEVASLAFAYGLAGFGYIITATFLPVIARGALPGSPWLDYFWPIFGFGVVLGALLSTRLRVSGDLRKLLAMAYVIQAAGIGASLWSPTLAGFAIGSLLLGLPFTAITFFAMQEVRRIAKTHPASMMGLLTAMYGIGQIVGPPLASTMLRVTGNEHDGFALSLKIAAAALLLGAAIFAAMTRVFAKRG